MPQAIEDQIMTIERALAERMIDHALVVVRSWLNELGENNPYEQAYDKIEATYNALFDAWLTSDTADNDEALDRLTSDTYRLVDEVFAAVRLHRGLSPEMSAFNPENPQSVMHYFANNVRLKDDDYQWLTEVINDPSHAAIALMAVAALAKNTRELFSERAIMTLIDGIGDCDNVVREQCLANAIMLLAHFDVRIDFFPDLQNAFVEAVDRMGDDADKAFATLGAIIRTAASDGKTFKIDHHEVTVDDLPEELQNLLEMTGNKENMSTIMAWLPESEQEYMQGLVQILPDTWVYGTLVGDDEERIKRMAVLYLSVGYMDLIWEHIDIASQWLLHRLREGSQSPKDYINYGHCLLLQGDRMMAYENYRQARQLCKATKEFFALFRPDRRALVDHGVPLEQIYLIEDKLLTPTA